MQHFIPHGVPPLGFLYNFGLIMWPERAILFGAKTGGRNNFLSCMPSAFRRAPSSSVDFVEMLSVLCLFLALVAEAGLRRAVPG